MTLEGTKVTPDGLVPGGSMPAPGFTEYVLGDCTPPDEEKVVSGGRTDGLTFVLGCDDSGVGVTAEVKGGTGGT